MPNQVILIFLATPGKTIIARVPTGQRTIGRSCLLFQHQQNPRTIAGLGLLTLQSTTITRLGQLSEIFTMRYGKSISTARSGQLSYLRVVKLVPESGQLPNLRTIV